MKRNHLRLIGILTAAVLLLTMAGCGGSQPAASGAEPPAGGAAQAAPAPSGDSVSLSLNHVGAVTHPYQAGAEKFAELVNERTGGAITIDIFPASQIASGAKAIEFVQMGTLDIAVESTMSLSNFVSEIDVLNMPFLFDSAEQAFEILDGPVGDELEKLCEAQGFKVLAWWHNGFRNISNSKRPIAAPEDLKGLSIRIPESEVFRITFETLGCTATSMPVSEVFTAIQLGTVDGQENPHANFINNKFYEVNKYYSITQHIFTAEPVIMSLDRFNSFTPEQQQILLDAAQEAAVHQRQISADLEASQMEDIKSYEGVEVNVIEDMAPFREAVAPVYEKFSSTLGKYVDMIEAAK